MPVTDDLRAIAERADRELDAVHDFFEHSKTVWRSFRILVAEGHKISAENLATGTLVDQHGLVRLAPQHRGESPPTSAVALPPSAPHPRDGSGEFASRGWGSGRPWASIRCCDAEPAAK